MSVHQVQEYFVFIGGLDLSCEQVEAIKLYLCANHRRWEFEEPYISIVVYGIGSESEGEEVEDKIQEIINNLEED